jgi:tetratricopeptide (TPR) repeat protein
MTHALSDAALWRQLEQATEQQDWRRAAQYIQPLAAKQPTHPAVLYVAAFMAYWMHDHPSEAFKGSMLSRAANLGVLAAQQAETFTVCHNAGVCLRAQDQHAAALLYLRRALADRPDNPSVLVEVGGILNALGARDEAAEAFRAALAAPVTLLEDGVAQSNAAMMLGKHDFGWQLMEGRYDNPRLNLRQPFPAHWQPWDGAGGRVVVHVEQGFGDILQMLRYLPAVAGRAERMWLVARDGMAELVQAVFPWCEQLRVGDTLPADGTHYVSLMSLPGLLGVGWGGAYLGEAYPHRPPRRIAYRLTGSASHRQDRNRSIRAPDVRAALLAVPGIEWIEAPEFSDWEQTRQWLLDGIDAVVAVDTSLPHLAGAMGLPCHVLLSADADSRWGLTGERTEWYPSWRLYRQPSIGDWTTPVAHLVEALT